ncbi:MAG: hypothetical protein JXR48_12180 [Candidatus Delongbacteria bacterium]|nr:hypothetical protein [Candidatus Delongbacteria bacterium]MBN2835710.1 hypothetical protein [Candidatus Delongbacteria bacterium]
MKSLMILLKSGSARDYIALLFLFISFFIVLVALVNAENQYSLKHFFICIYTLFFFEHYKFRMSKNSLINTLPNFNKFNNLIKHLVLSIVIISSIIYSFILEKSLLNTIYISSGVSFVYYKLYRNRLQLIADRISTAIFLIAFLLVYNFVNLNYHVIILASLNLVFFLPPSITRKHFSIDSAKRKESNFRITIIESILTPVISINRYKYLSVLLLPALKLLLFVSLGTVVYTYSIMILFDSDRIFERTDISIIFLLLLVSMLGAISFYKHINLYFLTFNLSRGKFTSLVVYNFFYYSIALSILLILSHYILVIKEFNEINNIYLFSLVFMMVVFNLNLLIYILKETFDNLIGIALCYVLYVIAVVICLFFYDSIINFMILSLSTYFIYKTFKKKMLTYNFK